MPLCHCLGKRAKSPDPPKTNKIQDDEKDEKPDENGTHIEPPTSKTKKEEKDENRQVEKKRPELPIINTPPALGEFLVSFLVDARGGAMTGCRGSGLRIIIPPGAVQQPVRVTCRYIRQADKLFYPPPLMEREALASRVVEVGPSAVHFQTPVLLEVPHFAAIENNERELIVLRTDDGETWKQHTQVFDDNGWYGGKDCEDEIYEDVAVSTGLPPVCDKLDTKRVVRISTRILPKYFALLFRIREEVSGIGPEGGELSIQTSLGTLKAKFAKGAVQKRIKVAIQAQAVPSSLIETHFPNKGEECVIIASPLVAVEPRRRRFHESVQLTVPLPSTRLNKNVGKKVHLLCSLTGTTANAEWEDLSSSASLIYRDNYVVFQTRVSALFWIFVSDISSTNKEGMESNALMKAASSLYKDVIMPPYIVRFVAFYRPRFPHAWCDSILTFCITDDKAEKSMDREWKLLGITEEVTVPHSTKLWVDVVGTNIQVTSKDCQMETGLMFSEFVFKAFDENSFAVLLKNCYSTNEERKGRLIFRRKADKSTLAELKIDLKSVITIKDTTYTSKRDKSEFLSFVTHRIIK